MGILLIDCSSGKIEFGFAGNEGILIRKELGNEYNADTLTYHIHDAFLRDRINTAEINYVCISNGPGSFTGLRIGSAIAKGICYALNSKLITVHTLDLIAEKFISLYPERTDRNIIPLIYSNSKSGEFYFSEYRSDQNELIRVSDHKTGFPDDILKRDGYYVINETVKDHIEKEFPEIILDISDHSNIDPLYKFALESIRRKNFSDHTTTEPFYMKEFIPNN